jgi:hypothetical protein
MEATSAKLAAMKRISNILRRFDMESVTSQSPTSKGTICKEEIDTLFKVAADEYDKYGR